MYNTYNEASILLEDVKFDFKNQNDTIKELNKAASIKDIKERSHEIELIFQHLIKGYLSICRKLYLFAGAGKEEMKSDFKYNHEIKKATDKYLKLLTPQDDANLLNYIRIQYVNFSLDDVLPFKKERQYLSLVLPINLGGFMDIPIKSAEFATGKIGKLGYDTAKAVAGIQKAKKIKSNIDDFTKLDKSIKSPIAAIRPSVPNLISLYTNLGLQDGKMGQRGAYVFSIVKDIDSDLQEIAQRCADNINDYLKNRNKELKAKNEAYQLALEYCTQNNIQLNKEQIDFLKETYLNEDYNLL